MEKNKLLKEVFNNLTEENKIFVLIMTKQNFESSKVVKYKEKLNEEYKKLKIDFMWFDFNEPQIQKNMKEISKELKEETILGISLEEGVFFQISFKDIEDKLKLKLKELK